MSTRARSRIQMSDMPSMSNKEKMFLIEYIKDRASRRAAEAAGFAPDTGYALLQKPNISRALDLINDDLFKESLMSADDLLMEMVDNHHIARQQGNISASNTALGMIGKHKRIDAFAADKIKVSGDDEVLEALNRGRARAAALKRGDDDEVVSFF